MSLAEVQHFPNFFESQRIGRRNLLYRIIIQTAFSAAEHLFAL